jgi:hypothetical protein
MHSTPPPLSEFGFQRLADIGCGEFVDLTVFGDDNGRRTAGPHLVTTPLPLHFEKNALFFSGLPDLADEVPILHECKSSDARQVKSSETRH